MTDSAPAAQPFQHPSLACFVLLAKYLGVAADPEQIAHDRGKGDDPYSLEDLSRIARKLGLIARLRPAQAAELRKLPVPALLETTSGDAVILLRVEDEAIKPRYLVQRGDSERPEVWSGADLAERFDGRALLLTSREAMTGDARPFDISWFIPALVKYRSPLRDVLIGSFFLQLTGLVSPIFFQLVIDKVLVHQSMTTLDVLAFGLAVIMIFETAMSGSRNELLQKDEIINNVTFVGDIIEVSSADALKKLCFDLKNKLHDHVAVLCANIDGKPFVAIGISDTVVAAKNLDAGKIIKEHVAPLIKGGGGGQKNLATAGGQDVSNLRAVIEKVKSLL